MDVGRLGATTRHSSSAQEYPVGGLAEGARSTQFWGPLHRSLGLCGRAPSLAGVGEVLLEGGHAGCRHFARVTFSFRLVL